MITERSLMVNITLLLICVSLPVVLSEDCQQVSPGIFRVPGRTKPPVTFGTIAPNTTGCTVSDDTFQCPGGQGVLSDGDIGPTQSVDVNDPDQVTRFFVWERTDTPLTLRFGFSTPLMVSYIDIYTLTVQSENIGLPITNISNTDISAGATVTPQTCPFSSSTNTLIRSTFTQIPSHTALYLTFSLNEPIDWMFISEIKLCTGTPPSPTCGSSTQPPTASPPPSTPFPTPPSITLSYPLGSTVTPDLIRPDSVGLTCSVSSPSTDDYQYQWEWRRNGVQLSSSDSRFSITHSTNTQSTTLVISGLTYSDAGDYTCTVMYVSCPDGVVCSGSVTGNILLNLPVVVEVSSSEPEVRGGFDVVVLTCEVYGYPRDSSPPEWIFTGRDLSTDRYTISLSNSAGLNSSSVSSTQSVQSLLTIVNVTTSDQGLYECRVNGNSTNYALDLGGESSGNSSNAGLVAGVVIALFLLIIIIVILAIIIVWMVWRYRKNGKFDTCSYCELGWCPCSCYPLIAAMKKIKPPRRHRENLVTSNGAKKQNTLDTSMELYSVVQKPPKKIDSSPPPLPPITLTETELNDLMNVDNKAELSPIHEEKMTRRYTGLSITSQTGSTPRLAKLTKLRKFRMKENPIYQSADELEIDNTLYALPSKANSTRKSASFTEGSTNSEPIYSEAIDPTMFTKRSSTIRAGDDLHPYGPIYTRPVKQKTREPLNVKKDNIKELKQIGVGQFGAVVLAEMKGLSSEEMASLPRDAIDTKGKALVAVKKLKSDVSEEVRQSFDKEIKFMSQLQHESIVQLLAVCTQREHPFIVMEYMENGDLNQFLQKYQMVEDDTAVYSNQIPPSALLYMAVQIASGMVYLASLNYVHRDLATRNCLVGSNFRIKISDFGMSRNLYERVYYRVRGRAMLPIRWMATESFYGRFSEKSDIWAYGVTVWEIYTLGKKQPYEELDDQDMIQDAIRGTGRKIMGRPEGCPQAVYEVLLRCWEYAAADRATFKEVHDSLNLIQLSS